MFDPAPLRKKLREEKPLIHCITNPISINQLANSILAIGARPMMAEHPKEVAEVTETAGALLLNLGSLTEDRMEAMVISVALAQKKGLPYLLDAVGLASTHLRRSFTHQILAKGRPAILKGNYSEIYALAKEDYHASGVDAEGQLTMELLDRASVQLARSYQTLILASGKVDLVTDGKRLLHLHNGTERLTSITGTGCMLGGLAASFLAVGSAMDAAVLSCLLLGIAGEKAQEAPGPASFLVQLLDHLAVLDDATLREGMRLEEKKLKEVDLASL